MCLKRLIKKMSTLEHFLFNSDYPTEKIVHMHEGRIEMSSGLTFYRDYVNTHIPVQLYTEGDYKISGSDSVYPFGMMGNNDETHVITTLGSFMYQGECWVSVVVAPFGEAALGKTLSYRIWSYYDEETAKNTDIKMTTDIAKPRIALTSDDNYPKFVGSGYVTQGQSYNHNLGYIPITKTWSLVENSTFILPGGITVTADAYVPQSYVYFGDASSLYGWSGDVVQVSNTQIITYPPNPTEPDETVPSGVYFRMYRI